MTQHLMREHLQATELQHHCTRCDMGFAQLAKLMRHWRVATHKRMAAGYSIDECYEHNATPRLIKYGPTSDLSKYDIEILIHSLPIEQEEPGDSNSEHISTDEEEQEEGEKATENDREKKEKERKRKEREEKEKKDMEKEKEKEEERKEKERTEKEKKDMEKEEKEQQEEEKKEIERKEEKM